MSKTAPKKVVLAYSGGLDTSIILKWLQVRFELGYYGLNPDIKVIAPWRDWDFKSRTDLLAFAEQHGIEITKDKRGEAPFSVDANLLHSSSEGKVLEDPAEPAPEFVHMRTITALSA